MDQPKKCQLTLSYSGNEGCPIANFSDLWAFAGFTSLINLVLAFIISFCALSYQRLVTMALFVYAIIGASFGVAYSFGVIELANSEMGGLIFTFIVGAAAGTAVAWK